CPSAPNGKPAHGYRPVVGATNRRAVSICASVRQASVSAPVHLSSAGSKLHRSGLPTILSLRPSSASHFAYTALWIACSFARLTAAPGLATCLDAFRYEVNWPVNELAGAREMMPLNSVGYRCAWIKACRPPPEQPSKRMFELD